MMNHSTLKPETTEELTKMALKYFKEKHPLLYKLSPDKLRVTFHPGFHQIGDRSHTTQYHWESSIIIKIYRGKEGVFETNVQTLRSHFLHSQILKMVYYGVHK